VVLGVPVRAWSLELLFCGQGSPANRLETLASDWRSYWIARWSMVVGAGFGFASNLAQWRICSIGLKVLLDLWRACRGLFYNYFRSFDPKTDRYPQPDPIGLTGG